MSEHLTEDQRMQLWKYIESLEDRIEKEGEIKSGSFMKKKESQDLSAEVARLLSVGNIILQKSKAYLAAQGVDVSDLVEWLTVEEYCEQFAIESPEIVISCIEQGIISQTNIRKRADFPEKLLIKALPYSIAQLSDS